MKRATLSALLAISLLGFGAVEASADQLSRTKEATPVEVEGDPIEPHRAAPQRPTFHFDSSDHGSATLTNYAGLARSDANIAFRFFFSVWRRLSWLIG